MIPCIVLMCVVSLILYLYFVVYSKNFTCLRVLVFFHSQSFESEARLTIEEFPYSQILYSSTSGFVGLYSNILSTWPQDIIT